MLTMFFLAREELSGHHAIACRMADRMSEWVAAMRTERYADAWALAAQTLAERDHATRDDPTLPYHRRWVWDGRPLDGRHVLVRCYHGLGDTIQFLRFLPPLAARAASVTVEIQPSLCRLAATVARGVAFLPFDVRHPLPPAEVDIEITELDFALRMTPREAAPAYMAAGPAILPRGTIGLCYGAGEWDAARSVPPALLAPLCRVAPCITLMPEPTDLAVLNPGGCPLDMDVTAALVGACDLVITVDTMIAHLAGALGKQTWLLLKAEPDWRWSPEQRHSAWYPAMRLYAQPQPGEWNPVIRQVEGDLALRLSLAAEI